MCAALALASPLLMLQPAQAQEQSPGEGPSAADRDTARALLDSGDVHFDAGRYDEALRDYEKADKIMGVPTTTVEVGRALAALGRLVEARDAYLRVIRLPGKDNEGEAFRKARSQAQQAAHALESRIATIELTVVGLQDVSLAKLTVDAQPVKLVSLSLPRRVNPGERRLMLRAQGYLPAEAVVTLAEGERKQVRMVLEPDPNAPKPQPEPAPAPKPKQEKPQPEPVPTATPTGTPLGYTVLAVAGFSLAGVGLGLGTATGVLALDRESELSDACPDKQCSLSEQERLDDAKLMANLSNAGFAIAGVGAITGVVGLVLTLTDDGSPPDADPDTPATERAAQRLQLQPLLGPGFIGVTGRF